MRHARSALMDPRLLDVDRHGVLAPPASFWWCMAFLLRHWILLLAAVVSSMGAAGTVTWAYGLISWPVLMIEAPMLGLLYAVARRTPDGGQLARRLWRKGRELIGLTAAMHLGWAVWHLSQVDTWNPWPERFLLLLALVDLVIIAGCWRSPVFKALFEEFPVNVGSASRPG